MSNDKYEPENVADRIIDKFLQSLCEEKGFEETSARLRKTLLHDKTTTEKTIRDALFGEGDV